MESKLLNDMGLGQIDVGYLLIGITVLVVIFIIISVIQIVINHKLKKKYEKFMQGKDAGSLEKDIIGLYEDNAFIKAMHEKHNREIEDLYHKLQITFQKIGIVKYDAFKEVGGQLSFSLALLDEKNSGFIINSVHSREGCYSYIKEIKNGECKLPLGEEEQEAYDQAVEAAALWNESNKQENKKTDIK